MDKIVDYIKEKISNKEDFSFKHKRNNTLRVATSDYRMLIFDINPLFDFGLIKSLVDRALILLEEYPIRILTPEFSNTLPNNKGLYFEEDDSFEIFGGLSDTSKQRIIGSYEMTLLTDGSWNDTAYTNAFVQSLDGSIIYNCFDDYVYFNNIEDVYFGLVAKDR